MAVSKRLRFEVLKRDGFTCRYCGMSAPHVELHVDHVHPRSRGGRDEIENLVAACRSCNLGKSHILLDRMAYRDPRLSRRYHVRSRDSDYAWQGPLVAVWDLEGDSVSDDAPSDATPAELLRVYVRDVQRRYGWKSAPIRWYVESPGQGKCERLPFQELDPDADDFLTFYTWPVDADTGTQLDWYSVPVQDKRWDRVRRHRGGFVQAATGWKPAIYDASVELETLLLRAALREERNGGW